MIATIATRMMPSLARLYAVIAAVVRPPLRAWLSCNISRILQRECCVGDGHHLLAPGAFNRTKRARKINSRKHLADIDAHEICDMLTLIDMSQGICLKGWCHAGKIYLLPSCLDRQARRARLWPSGPAQSGRRLLERRFLGIGGHVEVESGKRADRPKLAAALAACKKHRAKLVIAKLDRLSRNVAFIAALMDGKVDFVCCDFPTANRLTLHILAAVAEHEREMIAKRTKDGLAAAQARGVVLGNPALAMANKAAAVERAKALAPVLAEYAGMSAHQIAAKLNRRKIATPTGAPWSAKTVLRVRRRLEAGA